MDLGDFQIDFTAGHLLLFKGGQISLAAIVLGGATRQCGDGGDDKKCLFHMQ
ncbi:hypothetical protein D3C71_2039520 [compost metagenome]